MAADPYRGRGCPRTRWPARPRVRPITHLGSAAAVVAGAALLAAASSPGASPAPSAPKARVAVVLQGDGCPPKHTVELCEGIREAARRTGIRPRVVAPTLRENLEDFLALTAQQGYDAIVLAGIGFEPAVLRVARRYPDLPFIVLEGSRADVKNPPPNVSGLSAPAAPSRVPRRVAGREARAATVGTGRRRRRGRLEGDHGDRLRRRLRRRGQASRAARKVLVDYSDDFVDLYEVRGPRASSDRTRSRRRLERRRRLRARDACKPPPTRASGRIGVDGDQSFLGPHVLTSVLKRYRSGLRARVQPGQDRHAPAPAGTPPSRCATARPDSVASAHESPTTSSPNSGASSGRSSPARSASPSRAATDWAAAYSLGGTTTQTRPRSTTTSSPRPPSGILASTAPVSAPSLTTSAVAAFVSQTEPAP